MAAISDIYEGAQSVALVANGAIHDPSLIAALIRKYDRCVAVDGGLIHCHSMHLRPDFMIGDFDSVAPKLLELYSDIPRKRFPTDKDFTDMELAIRSADEAGMKKIGIFGAMELRTDHAVANLHLMRRYGKKVVIETERETLFMITGKHKLSCHPGQTVSLIPLGSPAVGVTTRGLKWELTGATMDTNFISLSNICLEDFFDIEIAEGDLICCLLRI